MLIVNVSPSLLALLWSDVSLSHLTRLLSRGSSDVAMNDKVAIKNEKWGMIEGFNGWLVGVEELAAGSCVITGEAFSPWGLCPSFGLLWRFKYFNSVTNRHLWQWFSDLI